MPFSIGLKAERTGGRVGSFFLFNSKKNKPNKAVINMMVIFGFLFECIAKEIFKTG